ncbi:hypothetical protein [Paraburkholderia franconis]|uniref:hypothetical protein n=1 Tax=Paraburkholderia franconis TaxID=2654983 RepID=UPI00187B2136|nr:hypothetical protein [Paraburkholderia franconis]
MNTRGGGHSAIPSSASTHSATISDVSPEQRRRMHRTTILDESAAASGVFA